MGSLEKMVNDKYGEKLERIAFSMMTGKYVITEVSQESDGHTVDTNISMFVDGSEVAMKLSKRVGF